MKCTYCKEEVFDTKNLPIGVELPLTAKTLHKCRNKIVRLVGLRAASWYVFEEFDLNCKESNEQAL